MDSVDTLALAGLSVVPSGLVPLFVTYPGLALRLRSGQAGAAFFRRFAGGVSGAGCGGRGRFGIFLVIPRLRGSARICIRLASRAQDRA